MSCVSIHNVKELTQTNLTTYKITPNDDWRDKLEVEIGDSKQPDFYPQVKIMRKRGFYKGYTPWNKGVIGYTTSWKGGKMSQESKEKMRQRKLGTKLSEEHKKKISLTLKGRMPKNLYLLDNSGSNSHWWKGGITGKNELARKSKEFKLWRKLVFTKDDYTCQRCKKQSKRGERLSLHPHHILNFAEYLKLRFDISNGITLCENCHKEFHKIYGTSHNTHNQLKEFLCQK